MKKICLAALVLIAVILTFAGCRSSSSAPCPNDLELIDRFTSREEDFVKLAAAPEDQSLLSALRIDRVVRRSKDPVQIWFPVWSQDFVGPGGCFKGYAYCEVTPLSLVESLDTTSEPGSPEIKEIYRPIKGNWHLFYYSDN